MNEDVFTMPEGNENRATTPDVVQLSEQIHRILGQPVHNGGSQGYSSLGSSGSRGSRRSHQQHLSASAASSSDSNGPAMDEAAAVASHKPVKFFNRSVVLETWLCRGSFCQRGRLFFPDDIPADVQRRPLGQNERTADVY